MADNSAEQIVRALYLGVLGREPEPEGLVHWAGSLNADPSRLDEVASAFHNCDEHQNSHQGRPLLPDHSQYGEYGLLVKLLVQQAKRHGIVVDVGARGRDDSNSFDLLHTHGWRGILVEANPARCDVIEEEYRGLSFDLVRCAVSDVEGEHPFYRGPKHFSLDASEVELFGPILDVIHVKTRKLGSILAERNVPCDFDVLSIDLDGVDIQVLNNLLEETAYRPAVIIVEASKCFMNTKLTDVPFNDMLKSSYRLACQTLANMILTRIP